MQLWALQTRHMCLQVLYTDEMRRFQVGEDSPVFPGLFSYCQVPPLNLCTHCNQLPLHVI